MKLYLLQSESTDARSMSDTWGVFTSFKSAFKYLTPNRTIAEVESNKLLKEDWLTSYHINVFGDTFKSDKNGNWQPFDFSLVKSR